MKEQGGPESRQQQGGAHVQAQPRAQGGEGTRQVGPPGGRCPQRPVQVLDPLGQVGPVHREGHGHLPGLGEHLLDLLLQADAAQVAVAAEDAQAVDDLALLERVVVHEADGRVLEL